MSASSEYKKLFSKRNLNKLYYEDIRYKTVIGIDRISKKSFEQNINENINIIYNRIHNGTYNFSKYKEKLISKGKSKCPRVISIPTIRDKLALKALYILLKNVFFHISSLPHLLIKKVIDAYKSGSYQYYLKLDIKNFYPSIDHQMLIQELKKKIKKQEILSLIKKSIAQITIDKPQKHQIIHISTGVPQGLSISNVLANIYLNKLDSNYSSSEEYQYFRFIDDILVLSKCENIELMREKLISECRKLKLTVHDGQEDSSKLSFGRIDEGFEYLGYKFQKNTISIRTKSIDKIRESIIKQFVYFKYSDDKNINLLQWSVNLRITGCIFNKTNYGWLFYFSQIDDPTLLHSLDRFVEKMQQRFLKNLTESGFKKFSKTIYEMRFNIKNTNYIPNFDTTSIGDKRRILTEIFDTKNEIMNERDIVYKFNKMIYRTIKELEKDLSRPS